MRSVTTSDQVLGYADLLAVAGHFVGVPMGPHTQIRQDEMVPSSGTPASPATSPGSPSSRSVTCASSGLRDASVVT